MATRVSCREKLMGQTAGNGAQTSGVQDPDWRPLHEARWQGSGPGPPGMVHREQRGRDAPRSARSSRPPGPCVICSAMSTSGVSTGMSRIQPTCRTTQLDPRLARGAWSVAVAAAAMSGTAAPRTASGASLAAAAGAWASALPQVSRQAAELQRAERPTGRRKGRMPRGRGTRPPSPGRLAPRAAEIGRSRAFLLRSRSILAPGLGSPAGRGNGRHGRWTTRRVWRASMSSRSAATRPQWLSSPRARPGRVPRPFPPPESSPVRVLGVFVVSLRRRQADPRSG